MITKEKVAMLVAEFLGTAILAYTVLAISTSNIGIGYFISFGAGLVLLLMVLAIGGVSGAVLNPAIALGLWTVRKLTTYQLVLYAAVQILGGLAAYALFSYVSGKHWSNHGEFETKVLVSETIGTAVFAMGVAAAVFQRLNDITKAIVIGGSLTLGIMIASVGSSGFINPAVALAARSWEWGSYVLGPVLGAVIGVNLYNLLFASSYKAAVVATAEQPATLKAASTKKAVSRRSAKKPAAKKKK